MPVTDTVTQGPYFCRQAQYLLQKCQYILPNINRFIQDRFYDNFSGENGDSEACHAP